MGDYDPAQWVEGDANIRRALGFLTGPEMLAAGHAENLTRLHDELIRKDWFQTLPDFNAYVVRKGQALSDYACDPLGWCKKCLVNIAKAGFFSSDRTIAEYGVNGTSPKLPRANTAKPETTMPSTLENIHPRS